MQVPSNLKARVVSKVKECLEKATAHYGCTFDMPTILFSKGGTTAGTANGSRWELNFNPTLLVENEQDFIERTCSHEVAHLIDYKVNPDNHHPEPVWTSRGWRRGKRDVHGADFKYIMTAVLGADDDTRCHNYDVSRAKVKKTNLYEYRCTCGCGKITTMGAKRHAREQARPGSYWLRGHGKARLELVNATKTSPMPIAAQSAAPSSHKRPTQGSNKDVARELYAANTNSRAGFIAACEAAGIKKTTASTYFQNFKSGMWK